jgi:hypothetical protein
MEVRVLVTQLDEILEIALREPLGLLGSLGHPLHSENLLLCVLQPRLNVQLGFDEWHRVQLSFRSEYRLDLLYLDFWLFGLEGRCVDLYLL